MWLGSMGAEGTVSYFLQMLKNVANVEKFICCCGGEEATRAWKEQKARRKELVSSCSCGLRTLLWPQGALSRPLSAVPTRPWWRNGNVICRLLWEWASLGRAQVCSYTWEVMRRLCGQSVKVSDRQNFLSATSKTERRGGLPAILPEYGFDSIVNLGRQKHCFSFFKGWKLTYGMVFGKWDRILEKENVHVREDRLWSQMKTLISTCLLSIYLSGPFKTGFC